MYEGYGEWHSSSNYVTTHPWEKVDRKKFPITWAYLVKLYFGGTWYKDTTWVSEYVSGKDRTNHYRSNSHSGYERSGVTETVDRVNPDGSRTYGGKTNEYEWETTLGPGIESKTTYSFRGNKFSSWAELHKFRQNWDQHQKLGPTDAGTGGKGADFNAEEKTQPGTDGGSGQGKNNERD